MSNRLLTPGKGQLHPGCCFSSEKTDAYKRAVQAMRELAAEDGNTTAAFAEAVAPVRELWFGKTYGRPYEKFGPWEVARVGKPRVDDDSLYSGNHDWCDHSSVWNGPEGKVAVAHPYHLSLDGMGSLIRFCEKYGLDAMATGRSFYYPGRTLEIVLKPTSAAAKKAA